MDDEAASRTPRVLADEVDDGAVGAFDQALGDPTVDLAHDVRIGLRLDGPDARRLPASVQARVLPATVFGTTFVDLVVPDGADASDTGLAAGQEIRQDQSSPTIELQDTLDDTDRVLSSLEPAQLATTLSSVANALGGRGKKLGGTIETLEAYLERLEPHLPLLQEVLRLAAIDLQVLGDVSPDILAAVDDSLPTNRTIVAKRQELATTFTDAQVLSRRPVSPTPLSPA